MSAFQLERSLNELQRRIHILEVQASMGHSSVSQGRTRFVGNESILVEGSGKVDGWWIVTGTQRVTGRLEGSGTLDWTGPWFLRGAGQITGDLTGSGRLVWTGPWDLRGAGQIKGNVDITGALDVKSRLTLGPSGYIEAGTVRIDRGGGYGGRIASTGAVLALSAGGSVVIDNADLVAGTAYLGNTTVTGNLKASGTITGQSKQFRIPHPTAEDHFLIHGCTESPVAGVEYWGDETLPETGTLTVNLPEYFEALAKSSGRTILVTARGFAADWSDIKDGAFAVTGPPGGRFSWLVKAERTGADFDSVERIYGPVRKPTV